MGAVVAIDNQRLTELYGHDMDMAADVFDASLRLLMNELEFSAVHQERRDVDALRNMLHKLKPVLGYVCQPALQEEAERLEGLCRVRPDAAELWPGFLKLERDLTALPEWMINQMNSMRKQGGVSQ
jgi:HPt (histidine-containing phosphotransfer) domain-containing protein